MKNYCVGDIHGNYKALVQCLERAKFNYDKDKLIVLGDLTDGWPDSRLVIEELTKIKNLVFVLGNHDRWFYDYINYGERPDIWTHQGGFATIKSYLDCPIKTIKKHREFLSKYKLYHIEGCQLFVHGGFSPDYPIEMQSEKFLTWDRTLWEQRWNKIDISPYKEVFVGHTSIWNVSHKPMCYNGVNFLDLGGGYEGCLCIMNIKTKKYWLSDKGSYLYPGYSHR